VLSLLAIFSDAGVKSLPVPLIQLGFDDELLKECR